MITKIKIDKVKDLIFKIKSTNTNFWEYLLPHLTPYLADKDPLYLQIVLHCILHTTSFNNTIKTHLDAWEEALEFLSTFNFQKTIYDSDSDDSIVESLLSEEEQTFGPNFNIPFEENGEQKYIQGNNIHKELAGAEHAFKRLFYIERAKSYSHIKQNVEKYLESETKIKKEMQEILDKQNNYAEEVEIVDRSSLTEKLKELMNDYNSTDLWGDRIYPNFATASVSYIGVDNKLHTKSIKQSELSRNDHPETKVFEYVEQILDSHLEKMNKYKKSPKIIIDIHTKLDMCTIKEKYNKKSKMIEYSKPDSCTKIGESLIEKYSKIIIRVSYDTHHSNGEGPYSYLCQSCTKQSMIQQRVGIFDYKIEKLNLNKILISEGGNKPWFIGHENSIRKSYQEILFNNLLLPQGFQVVDVEGDGNCFFRAVGRQLGIDHDRLREKAIDSILTQYTYFEGFTWSLDEYIDEMSQPGTWADHPIMQALVTALGINLSIYSLTGEPIFLTPIQGSVADTVNIAYTGSHYLSVEPILQHVAREDEVRVEEMVGVRSIASSSINLESSVTTQESSTSIMSANVRSFIAPSTDTQLPDIDPIEEQSAGNPIINTTAITLGSLSLSASDNDSHTSAEVDKILIVSRVSSPNNTSNEGVNEVDFVPFFGAISPFTFDSSG